MDRDTKKEIFDTIVELRIKLRETDYKAIKYAEGEISEAEYAETKEQRKAWRVRINELQAQLTQ